VTEIENQLKTKDTIIEYLESLIKSMKSITYKLNIKILDGRKENINQQEMIRNKINVLYSESFHKSMKFRETKNQNQFKEASFDNMDNIGKNTTNIQKLMSESNLKSYDNNNDNSNNLASSSKNYSLSNEIDHLDNEIKSLQSKLKYMIDVKK